MRISVKWPQSPALVRRLNEIQRAVGPNSAKSARVKGDIRAICVEDNTEKLLGHSQAAGVDRYGKPLAPLGEWAHGAAFRRRGNGPVLAPQGLRSRVITHFRTMWRKGVLIMGWEGVLSKDGRDFLHYHLAGCPAGSNPRHPNWALPKRDIAGISPWGWSRIVARHKRWAAEVLKGGR